MNYPRRTVESPEDRRRILPKLQETTPARRPRSLRAESREGARSPEVIMIEAFARLADARERSKDSPMRPSVELITDGSSIENQQIDIIDATDDRKNPRREVLFKIREPLYHHVSSHLEMRAKIGEVQQGSIEYHARGGDAKATLSEAWVFEHQGLTVRVAKGVVDIGSRERRLRVPVQTALGAVHVELAGEWLKKMPAEIGAAIHELLETRLGVVGGLRDPEPEDVEAYKSARYAWHHKLPPLRPGEKREVPALTRAEVYPGYHTMVEEGRHKEYLAMGEFAVYHEHAGGPEGLLKMIQHGGLSSTDERWRRGLVSLDGLSALEDLREGGAASFFTRCITEQGVKRNQQRLPSTSWNNA